MRSNMNWGKYIEIGKKKIDDKNSKERANLEKIINRIYTSCNISGLDIKNKIKRNVEYYITGRNYNDSLKMKFEMKVNYFGYMYSELHGSFTNNNISYELKIKILYCFLTDVPANLMPALVKHLQNNRPNLMGDGLQIQYSFACRKKTLLSMIQSILVVNRPSVIYRHIESNDKYKIIDLKNRTSYDVVNELTSIIIELFEKCIQKYIF